MGAASSLGGTSKVGGEPVSASSGVWLSVSLLRIENMRIKFVAVIVLVLAGGLLSGCVIDPGGYGHHRYYYDRY
jgi:hypothetical protein